jgi:simple sugar transport system ATP-binding protein
MTVAENSILNKYREHPYSSRGFLNKAHQNEFAGKLIKQYDIHPRDCENLDMRSLSGGNQQRLVIGREISGNPNLLIAVQPTRGLDVGAIEYVQKTLMDLRNHGKAILLISLETEEILQLSDTVAVLYNGQIAGIFPHEEADRNLIGLLMAGGKNNEKIG